MARTLTIIATLATAALFGWALPLARLFDAFQPMVTALSIMVAAVFVRLSRGMPSLEWKAVDPDERQRLTSRIVLLTKEYASIIAINAFALIGLVAMSVVGKAEIAASWTGWAQQLAAGAIGGTGALCVARMAYVVWRDIDVVILQKRIIDGTASRESSEEQAKRAGEKVANIRSAGIRAVDVPPPIAWRE